MLVLGKTSFPLDCVRKRFVMFKTSTTKTLTTQKNRIDHALM